MPGLAARRRALRRAARLQEAVQDRQHERRRLTRPRLRAADEVASFEKEGNRLLLDGRGDGVADLADRVLEAEVELPEDVRLVDGGRGRLRQRRHLHGVVMLRESGMARAASAAAMPPLLVPVEERRLAAPEVFTLAADRIMEIAHLTTFDFLYFSLNADRRREASAFHP